MIKDCKKHYSEMYRVRIMEDTCPFCIIEKLKMEIAMLEEANRRGNKHDDELIATAHREGWEKGKREAVDKLRWQHNLVVGEASLAYLNTVEQCWEAIAAMEYKKEGVRDE